MSWPTQRPIRIASTTERSGGKKASYLTASCPTGLYYAEGKVQFTDGLTLKITHALPCTPKG